MITAQPPQTLPAAGATVVRINTDNGVMYEPNDPPGTWTEHYNVSPSVLPGSTGGLYESVPGPLQDAVKAASQRARSAADADGNVPAQALIDAGDGSFKVTSLIGMPRVVAAIDGWGARYYGKITADRVAEPVKAIVGGESWIDFSQASENVAPQKLPA